MRQYRGRDHFFDACRNLQQASIMCAVVVVVDQSMPCLSIHLACMANEAHATSFSRASRHLLLRRVALPVREPPARGAAGQAMHFDVRTAGCVWSREVQINQAIKLRTLKCFAVRTPARKTNTARIPFFLEHVMRACTHAHVHALYIYTFHGNTMNSLEINENHHGLSRLFG